MLCWSSKKTSSQCSIRDFFMESIPTTEIKTQNMHYIWLFCSLDLIHNYIERLQQTAVEPFPPGLLRLSLDYHFHKFPLPTCKSSQPNVKSFSDQNVTGWLLLQLFITAALRHFCWLALSLQSGFNPLLGEVLDPLTTCIKQIKILIYTNTDL